MNRRQLFGLAAGAAAAPFLPSPYAGLDLYTTHQRARTRNGSIRGAVEIPKKRA